MDERELKDRLDWVEAQVMEIEDVKADLRAAGEAVLLLQGMVADLVRRPPEVDQEEYADDLERVDHLGNLLR